MKRKFSTALIACLYFSILNTHAASKPSYLTLKVYHYASAEQEVAIDSFLKTVYLPALHGAGVSQVGVFKAIANDTAADKKLYVLVPFESLKQWEKLLQNPALNFDQNQSSYAQAPYNNPVYTRLEIILLKSFEKMEPIVAPSFTTPRSEQVYELRSYEGPTEKYFHNKVKMFNAGGEVTLFKRLGFNAVFYSEVVAGSKMPNLMYMTTFADRQSREDHWKTFGSDPEWKALSSNPEYQNNVSHIDITFLHPADYSDL